MNRVLIVEDEPAMAEIIAENLRLDGLEVIHAPDGRAALELWRTQRPDLVVLDVMLPHVNGFEVCQRMRTAGDRTPVLFLSAKGEPEDRVQGLEVGGDDYLGKPFHLPEFLLRVRNILKRQAWLQDTLEPISPDHQFAFDGYTVDFQQWTVTLPNGQTETLGEREVLILKLLTERAGQVVSREDILNVVWGEDAFPSSRTVDNFIVRLRKMIEPDPSSPRYLHTVWGVGYRFTPNP